MIKLSHCAEGVAELCIGGAGVFDGVCECVLLRRDLVSHVAFELRQIRMIYGNKVISVLPVAIRPDGKKHKIA